MKLLFVIPEYSHGGTNKSLENLLSLIDKTKYQISVYCLYEDGGEYYKKVFVPYVLKKSRLYYWLHDNVWTRKMMGLYNKLTKKDNFTWLYKREAQWLLRKNSFDVVIGFQEGTATQFASYFAPKLKTIAWYHRPYMSFNDKEKRSFINLYSRFDHIVCVSNTFAKGMGKLFPELNDRMIPIYNLLNTTQIKEKGNLPVNDSRWNHSAFKLLSVGRFAKKSQFHLIPIIVSELLKLNRDLNFVWYIIASGDACEEETKFLIEQYNLQDNVVLLGAKDNPYPYMKQANVVVCTSDSESFSYVLAEAKVLHTPVLSNDFPVAYEVVDDSTGWIANIREMPQVLAHIIDNVDGEYDKKKASVMKYEYSNQEILRRIDELL